MELRAFRVPKGSVVELPGASVAWQRELQRLVEANAEVMLGVRFVASEYATGRHRGRIDTLGLDENGTPVIVEYKRTRDASVITQGLSYLSWLEDSRPEFEGLVRERLGAAVVETVDWSNPRLICVAAEFSPHDSVALEVIGRRLDLVAYRMFGDVLTLQLVASVAGTAPPLRGRAVTAARTTASGGPRSRSRSIWRRHHRRRGTCSRSWIVCCCPIRRYRGRCSCITSPTDGYETWPRCACSHASGSWW